MRAPTVNCILLGIACIGCDALKLQSEASLSRHAATVAINPDLSEEVLSRIEAAAQATWCQEARPEQTVYSMIWHDVLPHVVVAMSKSVNVNNGLAEVLANGSIYAFGVAQGHSMALLHAHFPQKQIYGFDSFEGLPSEDHNSSAIPGWREGLFGPRATEEQLIQSAGGPDIAHVIKGFFNDSLTPTVITDMRMGSAMYVDIDCDLHVSTYDALDWLFTNKIVRVGTLIGYDDWWTITCNKLHHQHAPASPLSVGEGLAHVEIAKKHDVQFHCVAGPCNADFMLDSNSFTMCNLKNNWGPIFIVASIGEGLHSNGFGFSRDQEEQFMKNNKVCAHVG